MNKIGFKINSSFKKRSHFFDQFSEAMAGTNMPDVRVLVLEPACLNRQVLQLDDHTQPVRPPFARVETATLRKQSLPHNHTTNHTTT